MLGLTPLQTTALYALLLFAVSALSGVLGYRLLRADEDLLTYLNAGSTGVILGVAFTHLLPDAMNALAPYGEYPLAAACSLGGFLLLILVETLMQDLNFEEEHKEAEDVHHAHNCAEHGYVAGAEDVHPALGTLQSSAIVQLRRRRDSLEPVPGGAEVLTHRGLSICSHAETLMAQRAAAAAEDSSRFGYGSFADASMPFTSTSTSTAPTTSDNTAIAAVVSSMPPSERELLAMRPNSASESKIGFLTPQDGAMESNMKAASSGTSFGVTSPRSDSCNSATILSPMSSSHIAKGDRYHNSYYPYNGGYHSGDVEFGHDHSVSHSHEHSQSYDHSHDHNAHEYDALLKPSSFARSECKETASLKCFSEDFTFGHNHSHSHNHSKRASGAMRNSSIVAFWGALMVHSTVEGLGIGVSSDVEQFAIVCAILIHKIFESLALSGPLFESKLTWTMKLVFFGSFCLSIPIGAVVGAILKSNDTGNSLFLGVITGVASGSFMYIGTMEMLPHTLQSCKNIRVGMALFVSAAVAMAALAAVV